MSGHRHEQIEATLRRALQQVLSKGLSDPRAKGMISVTEVQIAPDLNNATVLVSVYPDKHQDLTLHALKHAARHIRRQAGELVAMQRVPDLAFRVDESLKQQAEVFDALRRAAQERADLEAKLAPPSPAPPPTPQAPPGPGSA